MSAIAGGGSDPFSGLLGPISVEQFKTRYWRREMLHLPGAAGRCSELIGWAELSRLLESAALPPARLALVRGGTTVPRQRYVRIKNSFETLDSGRLTLELEQGATLLLNYVDELVPQIATLVDAAAQTLQVRSNANLYASWKPDNGLALHWDHHGVIVLQVAGRKQWQVFAPTRSDPLEGDAFQAPPPDAEPVWDGALEDGDLLYLPRGYPHIARAIDGPSLHLTLSLTETTGSASCGGSSSGCTRSRHCAQAFPRPKARPHGSMPPVRPWHGR